MRSSSQTGENAWARYELLKASWIHLHPDATQAEYEAAMRAIAKKCGV